MHQIVGNSLPSSLPRAVICLSVWCQWLPVGGCLFEAVLINFQSEQSKFIKHSQLCLKTNTHTRTRAHTEHLHEPKNVIRTNYTVSCFYIYVSSGLAALKLNIDCLTGEERIQTNCLIWKAHHQNVTQLSTYFEKKKAKERLSNREKRGLR